VASTLAALAQQLRTTVGAFNEALSRLEGLREASVKRIAALEAEVAERRSE
jgi:hypothetical protein